MFSEVKKQQQTTQQQTTEETNMSRDKKYFNENVIMAVEVEYEMGGRNWSTMKGSEVKDFCNRTYEFGDYISDIDFCTKQDDEWVKKVLNHAMLNWTKNYDWCKKHNLSSLDALIDYIIDNKLVA